MSNRRWLIVSLCTMLCSQVTYAQSIERRILGIEEMFRLADENSQSLKAYKTGITEAEEALETAKAERLPDVGASLSLSYLGNGYLWDRDFSNGTKVHIPHFGNDLALEAKLAIYSGGAISSGIELATLGRKMAALDWEKNRQDIRFLLIGYYLNLYKLDNQSKVLEKNLALTEQVIRNMKVRHKEGTALQNDITRYELQRETLKLEIKRVEDERKIISHQLCTTLHLPHDTDIAPDTTIIGNEVLPMAEADWQQMADKNHIGLRQASVAVKMNEQKVRLEKSAMLPKVAVVAGEHLDGPITIEVPTLNNNFNYWYLGVGVSYNLDALYKGKRKVKHANTTLQRSQEEYALTQERIENSVQAGYICFMTSYKDLVTQEKSVELANQNYRVTDNRYINGLALLTDMIDASNTKLSADLGLVNARINLIYSYYNMKYITNNL